MKTQNGILLGIALMMFMCCGYAADAKHTHLNTTNEVSTPQSQHALVYTLNAEDGLIIKDKNDKLQLVLKNVHKNVSYNSHVPNSHKMTGIQSLNGFVKLWQDKNPGDIEADVSGVQIDHKTVGHTQFYANALLSNPRYDNQTDELIFDFTKGKTPINIDTFARFHNATVFVNGCGLCDCQSTKGNCDIIQLSG